VALAACGAAGGPPAQPPATATASPSPSTTGSPPALRQVHDPGSVTGTLNGPCHFGGGQLPDPSCTPGAIDPQVTAAVLCAPQVHDRAYRPQPSQTSAFKYQQAAVQSPDAWC
jgi:hypothetical protein